MRTVEERNPVLRRFLELDARTPYADMNENCRRGLRRLSRDEWAEYRYLHAVTAKLRLKRMRYAGVDADARNRQGREDTNR